MMPHAHRVPRRTRRDKLSTTVTLAAPSSMPLASSTATKRARLVVDSPRVARLVVGPPRIAGERVRTLGAANGAQSFRRVFAVMRSPWRASSRAHSVARVGAWTGIGLVHLARPFPPPKFGGAR
jgi:hypothetical protein